MPLLEQLWFDECPPELFNQNMPEGIQLDGLKSIMLEASHFLSPPTLELVINQLYRLEELYLGLGNKEDSDRVLRSLQNDDYCFRHSLKLLDFQCCQLKEEGLETLLFDVLPRFPILRELEVFHSEIESLRAIESRIKQSNYAIPENRLRKLDFYMNPVIEKLNDDPKEKYAFMTILNTFNEISYVKFWCDEYGPDIEYLLRINHAGRKFIYGEGDGETTKKPVKTIQPGLWPKILERAYEKSDTIVSGSNTFDGRKKCSTGIFYLLRNGPILQDIIALRQDSNNNNGYGSTTSDSSSNISPIASDGCSAWRGRKRRLDHSKSNMSKRS